MTHSAGRSHRSTSILLVSALCAVLLAGCTSGDGSSEATTSASASSAPSPSTSTAPSGSASDALFVPGGAPFAEVVAEDSGLAALATGALLVDEEQTGPVEVAIAPATDSFKLRLMIFCFDSAEYRVEVQKNGAFQDATWGDSCSAGNVVSYLTAPVARDSASFAIMTTVPEEVGYRLVVYEVPPYGER